MVPPTGTTTRHARPHPLLPGHLLCSIFFLTQMVMFTAANWHAYNNNKHHSLSSEQCRNYSQAEPNSYSNQFKLWPGLATHHRNDTADSQNSYLYGFQYAIARVWEHQHPANCSDVKFLIPHMHYGGFGSEIHVLTALLGLAMNLNRVLLLPPKALKLLEWQVNNTFCRSVTERSNLECYYEPFSSCTLADALKHDDNGNIRVSTEDMRNHSYVSDVIAKLPSIHIADNDLKFLVDHIPVDDDRKQNVVSSTHQSPGSIVSQPADRQQNIVAPNRPVRNHDRNNHDAPKAHPHRALNDAPLLEATALLEKIQKVVHQRTTIYRQRIDRPQHRAMTTQAFEQGGYRMGFIPNAFANLVACSPMAPRFQYYWWRAVAASFIVRPNAATLDWIARNEPHVGLQDNDTCVSIYVRHGDKVGFEMKAVKTQMYFDSSLKLFDIIQSADVSGNTPKRRVLFVGSEDPKVMQEAEAWAKMQHASSPIFVTYTNLFDRLKQVAYMGNTAPIGELSALSHSEVEYLSMLLNLKLSLQCQGWVGTLASNWCRVVDELRTTVGGKINAPFADLSRETCLSPPCIGSGAVQLDWR